MGNRPSFTLANIASSQNAPCVVGRFFNDFIFHRLRTNKFIALFIGLFILVGLLALIALLAIWERQATLRNTNALAEQLTEQAEAQFAQIQPLTAREKRQLRRFLNPTHIRRARQLGVDRPPNRDSIRAQEHTGQLLPLNDNRYFYLQEMNYSVPSVTPSTAHLLTRLGRDFQEALLEEGLPPYRFTITSATRTRADQAALQRTNVNAARTSSHEFGTTVDVHYQKFDVRSADLDLPNPDSIEIAPERLRELMHQAYERLARTHSEKLKAVLGRTLLQLQQENQVLVIYERRQPVYHLTVAQEVAPPTPKIQPADPDSAALVSDQPPPSTSPAAPRQGR